MKKGFTLIEAMILLAIFGIILAVAMPAWDEYQDNKAFEKAHPGEHLRQKYAATLKQEPVTVQPNGEILSVFTDPATECQYYNNGTSMTPRMGANGKQMGCKQDEVGRDSSPVGTTF